MENRYDPLVTRGVNVNASNVGMDSNDYTLDDCKKFVDAYGSTALCDIRASENASYNIWRVAQRLLQIVEKARENASAWQPVRTIERTPNVEVTVKVNGKTVQCSSY